MGLIRVLIKISVHFPPNLRHPSGIIWPLRLSLPTAGGWIARRYTGTPSFNDPGWRQIVLGHHFLTSPTSRFHSFQRLLCTKIGKITPVGRPHCDIAGNKLEPSEIIGHCAFSFCPAWICCVSALFWQLLRWALDPDNWISLIPLIHYLQASWMI